MFVHSNEKIKIKTYFYVYVYFLIIKKKKKYEELELTKLEFHITRNSSLVSSSTIEGKKIEHLRLSTMLHGSRV